ncbi:MAG: DUF1080 domain-containing protein [Candidatus Hydrogenedentota bacterium]
MKSVLFVACSAFAVAAFAQEENFVPLFDGKSFDGWEGNLEVFRIEDGAIVGGSMDKAVPRNEFLCTTREFADFELRLQFKLTEGKGNAGVQFRTKRIPNHNEVSGFQADFGWNYWGCLYDESRRNKVLASFPEDEQNKIAKKDDWNEYVIRCEGPRIQFWLNGTQTVDYTETDESIARSGIIAVQIHGGPASEAWYRNIRVKELTGK